MAQEQTINLRPPLWLPLAAVIIGGCFYLAGKHLEKQPSVAPTTPGMITVDGEGKQTVSPDIAEISFGMQTGSQKTAAVAMQKLSDSMNSIYDALQKAGIDKKDISTENFGLNPDYDWKTGTQVLTGYEASQSLRVKVRNLDNVSAVVSAATVAGANQAGSVDFTVDNPDAMRADARKLAIDQAKKKAQTLADQLGVKLGAVKSFSEGSTGGAPVPMMMRDQAMSVGAAPASLPLPAGQQDVIVDVTLTYEID
jgi:uncharacterized protein YggE